MKCGQIFAIPWADVKDYTFPIRKAGGGSTCGEFAFFFHKDSGPPWGLSPALPQQLSYGMSLDLQLSFLTSPAVEAFCSLSSFVNRLCVGRGWRWKFKSHLFTSSRDDDPGKWCWDQLELQIDILSGERPLREEGVSGRTARHLGTRVL